MFKTWLNLGNLIIIWIVNIYFYPWEHSLADQPNLLPRFLFPIGALGATYLICHAKSWPWYMREQGWVAASGVTMAACAWYTPLWLSLITSGLIGIVYVLSTRS